MCWSIVPIPKTHSQLSSTQTFDGMPWASAYTCGLRQDHECLNSGFQGLRGLVHSKMADRRTMQCSYHRLWPFIKNTCWVAQCKSDVIVPAGEQVSTIRNMPMMQHSYLVWGVMLWFAIPSWSIHVWLTVVRPKQVHMLLSVRDCAHQQSIVDRKVSYPELSYCSSTWKV